MYSIKEFAHKVGFSRQYIWILIKNGRISANRIGYYYAIPESELAKFKQANNNQLLDSSDGVTSIEEATNEK
ncbi:MAG: hypothetical protein DAHOPDDO_00609 [Ignavibacteriaceae bacterium]|nr:hypothetical protein [Ignavibacteriaceae bacterium]